MPVYNKHKLIHIHIPKTGGTAIEELFHELGDMVWGPESWVGQEHRNGRWYEYQHLSIAELRELSNSEYENHHAFAVVRNPYGRLVSDYNWRLWISRAHPKAPVLAFDSFEAFIRAIPEDINANWSRHMSDADQSTANFLIHVRPQHQYVVDTDGRDVVRSIVRYENIEIGIKEIFDRFRIINTKIRNPVRRNFVALYDRRMLDTVNELYEKDFEIFGYELL